MIDRAPSMATPKRKRSASSDDHERPPVDYSDEAVLSPCKLWSQSIVTVMIATSSTASKFHVHKALLAHHSKWFRDALARTSGEDDRTQITLRDVKHETLIMFLEWLYKQNLVSFRQWGETYGAVSNSCYDQDLVDAYIFAHRYRVPGLKKILLQMSISYFNDVTPVHSAVTNAFGNLPASSTFLQLLVDATCRNGCPMDFEPDSGSESGDDAATSNLNLPMGFLVRVAKVYAQFARATGQKVNLHEADYASDDNSEI